MRGGLALAGNVDEITLLDIFTAIEQNRGLFKNVGRLSNDAGAVDFHVNGINAALSSAKKGMNIAMPGGTSGFGAITLRKLAGEPGMFVLIGSRSGTTIEGVESLPRR
jgi:hypothetical protein